MSSLYLKKRKKKGKRTTTKETLIGERSTINRASGSAIHASTGTFIRLGEQVLKPVMNPNDDAGTSYDEP